MIKYLQICERIEILFVVEIVFFSQRSYLEIMSGASGLEKSDLYTSSSVRRNTGTHQNTGTH